MGSGGAPMWPARVAAEETAPSAVLKAKKLNKVLVHSFGDSQYIWAKSASIVSFNVKAAEAALKKVASGNPVRVALFEALVASRGGTRCKPTGAPRQPPTPRTNAGQPPKKKSKSPMTVEVEQQALVVPEVALPNPQGLSAYELKRLETMEKNRKVLEALGVRHPSLRHP